MALAKLGNIKKVGKHYVDRSTGKRVPLAREKEIIAVQKAQGMRKGAHYKQAEATVTEHIMEKEKISYEEARQKARERIETSVVDREIHKDEPDYEEEYQELEWTP